jgi:hypothetical protein
MTPKEKAKQLCNKFSWEKTENGYKMFQTVDETKRCALIAVEEIMKLDVVWYQGSRTYDFYQEVKQEIEKL